MLLLRKVFVLLYSNVPYYMVALKSIKAAGGSRMRVRMPCGAVFGLYTCLYTGHVRRVFPAAWGVDLCVAN